MFIDGNETGDNLACKYCGDHFFTRTGKVAFIRHLKDNHFPAILLSDAKLLADTAFNKKWGPYPYL